MKTLLALVSVLAFGCQTSVSDPPTAPGSPDGTEGVSLRIATPDRIAGSYVDASGMGIEFDTARSGDNLFMNIATKTGHVLIHAETTADQYVFSYLDSKLTLRVDKT